MYSKVFLKVKSTDPNINIFAAFLQCFLWVFFFVFFASVFVVSFALFFGVFFVDFGPERPFWKGSDVASVTPLSKMVAKATS